MTRMAIPRKENSLFFFSNEERNSIDLLLNKHNQTKTYKPNQNHK
jgi:hypothetical protein